MLKKYVTLSSSSALEKFKIRVLFDLSLRSVLCQEYLLLELGVTKFMKTIVTHVEKVEMQLWKI